MSVIIGFLVFVEISICVLLVIAILMQPSKADSGVGSAFGGQATDALFGAGGGTVLAKITAWLTAIFFVLTFSLAILIAKHSRKSLVDPKQLTLPAATKTDKPSPLGIPGFDVEKPAADLPKPDPTPAPSTNKPAESATPVEAKTDATPADTKPATPPPPADAKPAQ